MSEQCLDLGGPGPLTPKTVPLRAAPELESTRAELAEARTAAETVTAAPDEAVMVVIDRDAVWARSGLSPFDSADSAWKEAEAAWVSGRKAEIARELAPLVQVMTEAGMFAAGLRVAVEADIKPLELGYSKAVDPVIEHRLTMARTHVIREAGIWPLPIPQAYIVLPGEAFIPVLGLRAEAEVIGIRPATEVR